MKVSRWGNSLAIRLNATVLDQLGVVEGDEVTIEPIEGHRGQMTLRRVRSEAELWERLENLHNTHSLPEQTGFDREDANSRG